MKFIRAIREKWEILDTPGRKACPPTITYQTFILEQWHKKEVTNKTRIKKLIFRIAGGHKNISSSLLGATSPHRTACGHWFKFKYFLLFPPSPPQVDVAQLSDLWVTCATLFLAAWGVLMSCFFFILLLGMLPHNFNNIIFYSVGSLSFFLSFSRILLNASWLEFFLCVGWPCMQIGTSLLSLA